MMASFRRILALIKKEFIMIWLDPKSRGVIIATPLLQLLIFANTVTMEIKNIDMAILDMDKTVESRELISNFEGSTHFRDFYYFEDEISFRKAIDVQAVQLGLKIKDGFGRNVQGKIPTEVLLVADGRSTNTAALAAGYANLIIANYSATVSPVQGAKLNVVVRNWFNPNLEYQWFILTIIVCMLSVVMTMILTSLSIARERELGTFDQLIVSPLSSAEILIGKMVPPLVISTGLTALMTIAVTTMYTVPFHGSMFLLLFSTFIALISVIGVGLCISSICKTQQQAMLSVMTFLTPITLTAGYISPIEDMPVVLQYLTYANPMRWYIASTKGLFLKGIDSGMVLQNCYPLAIISVLTLSLAAWTFKQKRE